jgi:pimeloyl-ACP methyl ester carboxylesterase
MSLLEVALFSAIGVAAASGPLARSADGVSIRYEVAGKGEPTVVLVHGWAFDRHLWDGQVPGLSARRRVVTLDLGGHGESGKDRARWTMPAFGEDVKAVVDAVGAKQVILVGHSMGGPVVLEAARRLGDRVKGLVLVDTVLDAELRTPADQIEAMARQLEADYRGTAPQMANAYLFAPATPAAVRERVLERATAIDPKLAVTLLREVWAYDPLPALREIKAPIRAVNADKFPTNLEANRRHMPGYEAVIVAGSGHYPMLEQPERFNAALDTALAQVLAARR